MVNSKHDVGWGNIYWQIFSTKKKGRVARKRVEKIMAKEKCVGLKKQ